MGNWEATRNAYHGDFSGRSENGPATKNVTNLERIRSMGAPELADFLAGGTHNLTCYFCEYGFTEIGSEPCGAPDTFLCTHEYAAALFEKFLNSSYDLIRR